MTSYVELALDSQQASRAYNGAQTALNWPQFDLGKQITNIVGIKVIETQIPFCWYVIDDKINPSSGFQNNELATLSNYGPDPLNIFYIPVGTYTATQLAITLQDYFNSADFSLPNLFPAGQVTTVTFSFTTLKFTIEMVSNAPFAAPGYFQFLLGGAGLSKNVLGACLGYTVPDNGQIVSNTADPGDTTLTLTSDKIANTTGPNYIYVNCATLGSQTQEIIPVGNVYFGGNGQPGPAIAKVPINCDFGGVIEWQDPKPETVFPIQVSSLQFIDFFLSSPWDIYTPLDLNGVAFSLKVVLICQDSSITSQQAGTTAQGRVGFRNAPY